ncbi:MULTISPECIES: glutaredoxin domain-containing protein [unclassified Rathayibacter]|uniref:glutaredoxin domain-containing protein n=1 Tax=unclassified Rathayibacter TaxID=2609250 RepID=UPI00188CBFED|nr:MULTISPECIES: glutaredoxin domain-containing protein [unclassified Rathayibacter]MBF4461290.1 NrdH-redoxin [Rathayibacter sp. VKM Ac-2879]MBF4502701.1 NrdH-redoxin [Rathayibacter sp. VKM Ac-2878]
MDDEPLTVYSKDGCVQCTATLRALDNAGVAYRMIDLAGDPVALQHVKESGFLHAPVIKGAGDPWSGFRPDRIDDLVKSRAV